MNSNRFFLGLLFSLAMLTTAYCQVAIPSNQVKTVNGTVTKTDFVGSTISISTEDQHDLSFYVPSNAVITHNAHDAGLMDIKRGHAVIIQYDVSSPGKNSVETIVDNNPTADESIDE